MGWGDTQAVQQLQCFSPLKKKERKNLKQIGQNVKIQLNWRKVHGMVLLFFMLFCMFEIPAINPVYSYELGGLYLTNSYSLATFLCVLESYACIGTYLNHPTIVQKWRHNPHSAKKKTEIFFLIGCFC